jgi:hypothetical protein
MPPVDSSHNQPKGINTSYIPPQETAQSFLEQTLQQTVMPLAQSLRATPSAVNNLPENSRRLLLANANINFSNSSTKGTPAETPEGVLQDTGSVRIPSQNVPQQQNSEPQKFLSYAQLGLGNIPNPNRIDLDKTIQNSPRVASTIANVAGQMGLNPRGLIALGQLESSLNPNTTSPNGAYKGLYQISDRVAARYGINAFNPEQNAHAAFSDMKNNMGTFSKVLGVPAHKVPVWLPYLYHQQGDTGGKALGENYVNPNTKGRLASEAIQEAVYKINPNSSTNARANLAGNIPQEYVDAHKSEYPGMGDSQARYAIAGKITVEEMVNAIRSRLGPAGDEPILAPSTTIVAKK